MMRPYPWQLALLLTACNSDPASVDDTGAATTTDADTTDADTTDADTTGTTTEQSPSACAEAEQRLGLRVCMHEVADEATWSALSLPVDRIDQVRTGKYLAPARADARLPALVMDVNAHSLHYQFLRTAFPERFPDLTPVSYEKMISDPAEREFFAGSITEYRTATDERVFGYVAWDPQTDLATTLTCDQFQALHASLSEVVTVGSLAAVPTGDLQRQVLAGCDVPSYDATAAVDYESYTTAVGFGTVRRYTPAQLVAATQSAAYGFQDILVLQEAPLDIERVISGAVTGGRQAELSHLNVRSAARGTPNCYLRDAHARMAAWDGKLVRLECGQTGLDVRQASPEEAQSWWEQLRPDPVEIPAPDLDWLELSPLHELPTADPDERLLGLRRYGAKGRNLATLYQRIDASLQIPGFLIPFHYYDAHLAAQQWTVDLGDGPETLSIAGVITRLLADPEFRSDPALRQKWLGRVYDAIRDGECDPAMLAELHTMLLTTFGADTVMARFRSSSNAEDAPGFSGAGLYESTNACLADDLDADAIGPSRCDKSEPDERGLCRAAKKVWASLWLVRAFEERDWYGIDHHEVAMGILVDERHGDEKANMVVFTGDPNLVGDGRFLVNAQQGDAEVVSPEPGTWPEETRLTVVAGAVTKIDRVRGSSELPEGQYVLSDMQLQQLGGHMWQIRELFPIDEPAPPDTAVLLDTEWKVRQDDTLLIKQIRPYLRRE